MQVNIPRVEDDSDNNHESSPTKSRTSCREAYALEVLDCSRHFKKKFKNMDKRQRQKRIDDIIQDTLANVVD